MGGGECRDSWAQKGLRKDSRLNERWSVPSTAPGTSLCKRGTEKMEEPKDKKGWKCHSHGNHELKAASDVHTRSE